MPSHDKLNVINNALMKIGLPLAATLDDCDWNAASIYDLALEQVLRSFAWGFASRFATLPKSGGMPAHGYRYAYTMPEDCLKIIDIRPGFDLRSPRSPFVISGRDIFTNASPCNIRYVAMADDAAQWPPDFADAVACRIALEIAPLSAQTMSMTPGLLQLYQIALANAQAADARESCGSIPADESVMQARGGR